MISGRRPSGGGSSVRAGRLVDTYRSQAVNSCRRAGRSAVVVGMWGLRLRRVAPLIAYRSPLIMPRDGQLGIDARGPKSLITRAGCRLVLKIRRLGTMLDVPTERARPALTNLAYLDWLRDSVAPPDQARHTTYRLDREPALGVLWTYAESDADGTARRVGGGRYDPATDRYEQGAFNADNVVLWMQPDGTLNASAEPPEIPDPSDAGESCWLSRTIWALGEAYAAFRDVDPVLAAFLGARFELALGAVERQSLASYGVPAHDGGGPAWLIANGADTTGEALLGLAAYVQATGCARAATVLDRLAAGV